MEITESTGCAQASYHGVYLGVHKQKSFAVLLNMGKTDLLLNVVFLLPYKPG